ncbi:unnamed protein product [Brassica napus]|uniref:(rape) hypothetical protein n=1 Tax=Brassica napus TaxID=3708 RepID=A0A816IUX7_BRANA|nr:unnamed protein product [Brassica napus]
MLNQKRIEQSSWFSEQGIPKACFVPIQFLETVGYSYENLQKPDKKRINILKGWVKENPLIQKLAVLIPAIKLEMMNEEINFNDIVPF